jgi:hypothetical protein
MLTWEEVNDVKLALIHEVDAFSVRWVSTVKYTHVLVISESDEELMFRVVEGEDQILLEEM